MGREEVRAHVNAYCKLRDVQFAAYELYARSHHLTSKELFVLELLEGQILEIDANVILTVYTGINFF